MDPLARKNAEIALVVEEIMFQFFILMVVVLSRYRDMTCRHSRNPNCLIRYRMADRIPRQINHMRELVGLNDDDCLNNLRMNRETFYRLCYVLQYSGGLANCRYVFMPEQVALFLSVLAHHTKVRIVKFNFKRSGQTVNKYFHDVLNCILKLHERFLATPEPVDDDCNYPRWKWFKGCLGALDGTYTDVTVSESDKPRYHTRKGDIATHVLAVCDRKMWFVYMLSGWEGSAADCRVLRDALGRPNGFKVPQGHFYLYDNRYANAKGFLTPYKAVRYHLDEWGQGRSAPQNYQEFFNMNHSKARNVIERTFGLLKKRWSILRSATFYPIKIQNRMILTSALIHNFFRTEMPVDPLEQHLNDVPLHHDEDYVGDFIDSVQPSQAWSNWRDNLARSMFNEWRA